MPSLINTPFERGSKKQVRRFLAIALALLLGFSPIAAAFAQNAQRTVMLCCRKGGTHDCMSMAIAMQPALRAHCPVPPATQLAIHAGGSADTRLADHWSQAAAILLIRPSETGYRMLFDRSRQDRGPPAARLS
jgi:hypothetical protein